MYVNTASPPAEIEEESQPAKTRRGTEVRAKGEMMAVRVTWVERAEIEKEAKAAGFEDLGAYVRAQAMAKPETQAGGNGPTSRPTTIYYRATPAERTVIEENAARCNLTPGAFARARALRKPVTLARNRVPIDRTVLAQILALMGRLSGNTYQIAKRGNFGEASAGELADELRAEFVGWREAKDLIMRMLGKRPS